MVDDVQIAVIGAGSVGLAVAYYAATVHGLARVAVIDARDPLSLTSAQSGENYRNWWPHPVMTAFTDHSISLMEDIARQTCNRIQMTRRGYALATRRSDGDRLVADLVRGYGGDGAGRIRVHHGAGRAGTYAAMAAGDWQDVPPGVDVLLDRQLIRRELPAFAHDVEAVLHVRRAGSIDGQQLGQYMLEAIREAGGRLIRGEVVAIEGTRPFALRLDTGEGRVTVRAECLVDAAGPFVAEVAALLGESLPVRCVYQQKISFTDHLGAVPRHQPFAIDLDEQRLDWTDDERALLATDPATAHLTEIMSGGIHCRPDGPASGQRIKLGWAFNRQPSDPHAPEPTDEHFPDIVLRGASRLQPALKSYLGRLPRGSRHYGGYYTLTEENWPRIGPLRTPGAYVAGALSGFGTMAACSAGALCADWIAGVVRAPYARPLSPARYDDPALMAELATQQGRGIL